MKKCKETRVFLVLVLDRKSTTVLHSTNMGLELDMLINESVLGTPASQEQRGRPETACFVRSFNVYPRALP